jgi:hypothetical protein
MHDIVPVGALQQTMRNISNRSGKSLMNVLKDLHDPDGDQRPR